MDVNSQVAVKIRKLREKNGYSQEYVATEMGIPQNSYSSLENGKVRITIEKVFLLSKIFNESIYEILDLPAYQQFQNCSQQTVNGSVVNNGLGMDNSSAYSQLIESKNELIQSLKAQIEILKRSNNI